LRVAGFAPHQLNRKIQCNSIPSSTIFFAMITPERLGFYAFDFVLNDEKMLDFVD